MLGEFFALAYPYHQKSIELKWNEILYVNPNSLYMLMLIGFRVGSKQFLLTLKDNVKNKGIEKSFIKYESHNFSAGCFIQNNRTFWLIYAW